MTFTVLGLEPGEHTLTFVLKTQHGQKDIVEKKLRVVVRARSTPNTHMHSTGWPKLRLLVLKTKVQLRNAEAGKCVLVLKLLHVSA